MADPNELPRHLAYAAQALLAAAKKPGLMVLALCQNTEGNEVATLCMLNESNGHLYPFALVPDFDLCELLTPPAEFIAPTPRAPAAAPPKRSIGFTTEVH